MAIKTYRPITPSLRFKTTLTNDELTTDKPHKPLTRIKLRTGGRRNAGDITIVSTGNDDAAGAHKITGDMTRIAAQVPALFEALSGMDIKQLMSNVKAIKQNTANGEALKG